jgi:hypothetical protein
MRLIIDVERAKADVIMKQMERENEVIHIVVDSWYIYNTLFT